MDIFHTDMNFEYINIWLCSKEGHKWASQYLVCTPKFQWTQSILPCARKQMGPFVAYSPLRFTQIQQQLEQIANVLGFFHEKAKWFPESLNMNES